MLGAKIVGECGLVIVALAASVCLAGPFNFEFLPPGADLSGVNVIGCRTGAGMALRLDPPQPGPQLGGYAVVWKAPDAINLGVYRITQIDAQPTATIIFGRCL